MKKHILAVILILSLIVTISGCTSQKQNNYSSNGISFNYPNNWKEITNVTTQNAIVAVGDPDSADQQTKNVNTLVVVQKVALPSGSTLKQFYDSTYAQFAAQDPSFKTISDTTTTVDGTTAYINTHTVNVNGVQKEEKAVWLEKNGSVYVILCGTLPPIFDSQQANFNMIINSFKIQ
ncbi:MAG TPA: PsbP-related protein [Methanobacterium sp.]|nr:PsbP-related protein [Methanobacterium sp.]